MEATDIGKLIGLAIRRRHESYRGFAKRNPPLNPKTLMSAIRSERKPIARSRALIEDGLGWESGTIDWLWANYADLSLSDIDLNSPISSKVVSPERVARASDLSNDELFAEVMYRMRQLTEKPPHPQ